MCGQYWKKWEEPSGYFFHKYYLYNYKRVWIVFLISNKETAALSNRSCRSIIRWANSTPWTVTDRHFDVQRSKQPVTGCQLHGGYVYAWCVSRALIEGCTIMASRKRFKTDNKELWPTFGRTADPHLLCPVDCMYNYKLFIMQDVEKLMMNELYLPGYTSSFVISFPSQTRKRPHCHRRSYYVYIICVFNHVLVLRVIKSTQNVQNSVCM